MKLLEASKHSLRLYYERNKDSIKNESIKAVLGIDDYSLAKRGHELGKQMMDRVCVCGHQCREHNFIPHTEKTIQITTSPVRNEVLNIPISRTTELHDNYCQCQECQK